MERSFFIAAVDFAPLSRPTTFRRWAIRTSFRWTEAGGVGPKPASQSSGSKFNPAKTRSKGRHQEEPKEMLAGAGGLEPPPSSLTVRCPTDWTTPQLIDRLPYAATTYWTYANRSSATVASSGVGRDE